MTAFVFAGEFGMSNRNTMGLNARAHFGGTISNS
jgi:hypothetical protein